MAIYVVARRQQPNLGVHTSARRAHAHVDTCVADRVQHGAVKLWDIVWAWRHSGDSIRRVLVQHAGGDLEEFHIEKWYRLHGGGHGTP